jgi:sigma-B regulation protein RsbU (phosphoserine phosphatase)
MDYKNLFRKLENTLADIEASDDRVSTVYAMLQRLVDDFHDDLGLVGGRIYVRRGSDYVLQKEYPEGKAPEGFRIADSYEPLQDLMEHGFVFRQIGDPGIDREIESALGVKTFAAIGVGDRSRQIIAFTIKPGSDPDNVQDTLMTVRHVINIKLRQLHLEGRVAETRAIQMSLLPRRPPSFEGFDVWGASVPAEEVGGDLYDYLDVSKQLLGIAVADSAGHGLPAALQARDAIIGLRMGVEERLRITSTIEKLNRVVSRSVLASKFISLFYGEIESQGTMVYCNAGHPPPLVYRNESFDQLSRGGLILGPDLDARYERGYVRLTPGSVLLAYTDGITEALAPDGSEFGVGGLKEVIRARRWTSARDLVEAVFDGVRRFSRSDPPDDDQTVVAVLRDA